MPKSGKKTAEQARVAGSLVHQLRRPENARFLRRVPGFEVPADMPTNLQALLYKLNDAEGHEAGNHD